MFFYNVQICFSKPKSEATLAQALKIPKEAVRQPALPLFFRRNLPVRWHA